jgi:hypothetical protein
MNDDFTLYAMPARFAYLFNRYVESSPAKYEVWPSQSE